MTHPSGASAMPNGKKAKRANKPNPAQRLQLRHRTVVVRSLIPMRKNRFVYPPASPPLYIHRGPETGKRGASG